MSEHDEDGYSGEATLVVDGVSLPVTVELRGYFQPIDGFYRWYGRVAVNEELTELAGGKKKPVTIQAGSHSATGEPDHGHEHPAVPRADDAGRTQRLNVRASAGPAVPRRAAGRSRCRSRATSARSAGPP
jgi:hypothetical protein